MLRSSAVGPLGRISVICLFIFGYLASGCGSDYRTSEEKNFILHANTEDLEVHAALQRLTDKFNLHAGFKAISYSEAKDGSNSPISLVKNLVRCSESDDPNDRKIGCGQWLADVSQEDQVSAFGGPRPKQVTSYHMRLELDDEWFRARMNSEDPDSQLDLMKLFFHEVGHGLQMGHDPVQSAVMFRDISGSKDFNGFFRRVRDFFAI